MKSIISLIVAATLVLFLGTALAGNTNVPAKFKTGLQETMDAYYPIRSALAADKSQQAAEAAKTFAEKVSGLSSELLPLADREVWQKQAGLLKESALKISQSADLAAQRGALYALTNNLLVTLKTYGPLEKPVYRQTCPMAFGSKSGDWLSDSKDILNPYLGASMPGCGMNKGEVNKTK